jgi:hypothetical protein
MVARGSKTARFRHPHDTAAARPGMPQTRHGFAEAK